jgi:hypothetical protein
MTYAKVQAKGQCIQKQPFDDFTNGWRFYFGNYTPVRPQRLIHHHYGFQSFADF